MDCGRGADAVSGAATGGRGEQIRVVSAGAAAVGDSVFGGAVCGYGAGVSLSTQRILGVLQRIAICYVVAAGICLVTKWRGQILWAAGFLGVYGALMLFAPVP